MIVVSKVTRFLCRLISITNATNQWVHFSKTWRCNSIKLNSKMRRIFQMNWLKHRILTKEHLIKLKRFTPFKSLNKGNKYSRGNKFTMSSWSTPRTNLKIQMWLLDLRGLRLKVAAKGKNVLAASTSLIVRITKLCYRFISKCKAIMRSMSLESVIPTRKEEWARPLSRLTLEMSNLWITSITDILKRPKETPLSTVSISSISPLKAKGKWCLNNPRFKDKVTLKRPTKESIPTPLRPPKDRCLISLVLLMKSNVRPTNNLICYRSTSATSLPKIRLCKLTPSKGLRYKI